MDHEVFLADHVEYIGLSFFFKLDHRPWMMRMSFRITEMIIPLDTAEGEEYCHVQRTVNLIHVFLLKIHFRSHEAAHKAARPFFELDSDSFAPLSFLQLAFYFDNEILCIFFVYIKIGISGKSEGSCFQKVIADEESCRIITDDLFQENEIMSSRDVLVIRKADNARQHGRNRNDGSLDINIILFILRHVPFISFQQQGKVQALGGEEREWMGRVDSHRCHYREYLAFEIFFQPSFLFRRSFIWMNEVQPFTFKFLQKDFQISVLAGNELLAYVRNSFQLFFRRHVGNISFFDAIFLLVPQSGYTDHEKFIQVRTGNRKKF